MKMILTILLVFLCQFAWAAQSLSTFQVVLDVSGVREAIQIAPGTNTDSIVVQNPSSNVVSIFVGDSTVTTSGATIGLEVPPGQTVSVQSANRRGTNENLNTSLFFMVSTGTSIPVTVGVTIGRKP